MCGRFLTLLTVLWSGTLFSTTHLVTNTDDSGAGSLRDAIGNTTMTDTVRISPALLANGSDTIFLSSTIYVNEGITILGAFNNTDSIYISGRHATSFLSTQGSFSSGRFRLRDLALIDFYSEDDGGAIYLESVSALDIANCHFSRCSSASRGGAVFANVSYFTWVNDCTFRHCEASEGGGVNLNTDTAWVSGCSFEDNKSTRSGAAMNMQYGTYYVEHSRFLRNHCLKEAGFTSNGGGAIYFFGRLHISRCSFVDNILDGSKAGGGAVCGTGGGVLADHVLFENNASIYGGAVSTSGFQDSRFTNCTFTNNRAVERGGALTSHAHTILDGRDHVSVKLNLKRCTFSGNQAPVGSVLYTKATTNAYVRALFENCTVIRNTADENEPLILNDVNSRVSFKGSVIADNEPEIPVVNYDIDPASYGYNAFANTPDFAVVTDITNVTRKQLALSPLSRLGRSTPIHVPSPTSILAEAGDWTDASEAQSGAISGIREIGAAESAVWQSDTVLFCGSVEWWGEMYNLPGTYEDSVFTGSTTDSIGFLTILDSIHVEEKYGVLIPTPLIATWNYQWITCDPVLEPIPGETGNTFDPSESGYYAVVVSDGSCADTSDCVYLGFRSPSLRSFPNPVNSRVYFEASSSEVNEVMLTTVGGAVVLRKEPDWQGYIGVMDVSNVAAGVYLISVRYADGTIAADRILVVNR